jgi:hypothetical protein
MSSVKGMAGGAKAFPGDCQLVSFQHTFNVSPTPSAESANPIEGTYRASGRNSLKVCYKFAILLASLTKERDLPL